VTRIVRVERLLAVLIASLSAGVPVAAGAATSPHDQLTAIAEASVAAAVAENPIVATHLGIAGHDGELAMPSEHARAARIARLREARRQVVAIAGAPAARASLVDRDDARLLLASFDGDLTDLARQDDRKNYAGPALSVTGAVFTQFLHLPVEGREGATRGDIDRAWADISARLERAPASISAGQRMVTRPDRLAGEVGLAQLDGASGFFGMALRGAAKSQLAHDPAALARLERACDAMLVTIETTKKTIGERVKGWPDNHTMGRAAYDRMLRDEQLLPFNADDVERMGRDELAHGWAEEAWLMSLSNERGVAFGAASGGGMAPDGPPLVDYYRARLDERRKFVADHDVITVPAWLGSMEIVETPAFLQPVSPGASMNSPRLFGTSTTGYYFITPPKSLAEAAERLDMNEDFDRDRIWSTGAHEAFPGHFFQLSIAHRHPDYIRRISDSSAFAEGWAFYGEEMFVRLGLYGDDLDARLFTARWERVRGARAIVDVKMATGAWSVDEAAKFLSEQSGFTLPAATAAVRGFALRPGYAIAYTVGRFQLETLLADYLIRAGENGSLHDFHDRLMSYGSVPFAIVGPELLRDLVKPAAAVRESANY
jgi:uncharacterized protein (DUF885 family)